MTFRAFHTLAWVCCTMLWLSGSVAAEQIRYDSASQWRAWPLPLGVVELAAPGVVHPVEIRKNIDPLRNAAAFDGGIRAAGSNPLTANRALRHAKFSHGCRRRWRPRRGAAGD